MGVVSLNHGIYSYTEPGPQTAVVNSDEARVWLFKTNRRVSKRSNII